MRVAVLSDVHGNLPALEAVLSDVDGAGVNALVVTGDVAAGPLPTEAIDALLAAPLPVLWISGNADRGMVEAYDGAAGADVHEHDRWLGEHLLTAGHRDLLAAAAPRLTLDIDGLGRTLFCHATPRSDDEVVLVDSAPGVWADALAGVGEHLVVCGHTHMPYDRLAGEHRVVNPGSVGMAYGPPGACWAVLGPHVELRRTPYDRTAAAVRLRESRWPGADQWVREYVENPPDARSALAAFTAQ